MRHFVPFTAAFAIGIATCASAQTFHEVAKWDLHVTSVYDYMTPSPANHRLYVAAGTQIIIVDTQTGAVAGTIPGLVHVHGVTLAADGKTGYISDGGANKIVIFDVESLKVTGSIATEGDYPDSLLIDPSTGLLITFNGHSKTGVTIDLAAGKVVGSFPVPGKPEFSQADGKGNVFVNVETTGQLLRIDVASHKVVDTWKLAGCPGPSGLALDKAHSRLFSVCDGHMAVTDAATGKQVALVAIGDGPDAVWYDAQRSLIFASNGDTGTLSIIHQDSADKYTVKQTIKTTAGARTMAYDDTTGTAYVIAPAGGKVMPSSVARPLFVDVIAP